MNKSLRHGRGLGPTSPKETLTDTRDQGHIAKGKRKCSSAGSDETPKSPPAKKHRKRCANRFGCPFAKHADHRYQDVYGSCTHAPGLQLKYVKEHLLRNHSAKTCCLYCNHRWLESDDWESAMIDHMKSGECPKARFESDFPEWMSAEQQKAVEAFNGGNSKDRWNELYKALFPDEALLPNPAYDYYVKNDKNDLNSSWVGTGLAASAVSDQDICESTGSSGDALSFDWSFLDSDPGMAPFM